MTTTVQDREIGAREAAEILGKDVQTVQRMCRERRLNARQIGGRGPWHIRLSSVVPTDLAPPSTPTEPKPEEPPKPPSEP